MRAHDWRADVEVGEKRQVVAQSSLVRRALGLRRVEEQVVVGGDEVAALVADDRIYVQSVPSRGRVGGVCG